jgi:phenylalanyl-tRNA synthetase beta chain
MKIPLSWIREFAALPKDVDLERIENAFVGVGFEVEGVDIQGSDLKGPLVVAKVIGIEELVGNKKPIRYVELDCGEAKTRFVICGATNFAVNDLVVAALPGAVLPGGFSISAREKYGKTSYGMISSAGELGISDEHSGIIVLPADCAKVGTDAIELLENLVRLFVSCCPTLFHSTFRRLKYSSLRKKVLANRMTPSTFCTVLHRKRW